MTEKLEDIRKLIDTRCKLQQVRRIADTGIHVLDVQRWDQKTRYSPDQQSVYITGDTELSDLLSRAVGDACEKMLQIIDRRLVERGVKP
jgi:hypothetical protein